MNYCEARRWTFTITADQDVAVKAAMGKIPASGWKPYDTREGITTEREMAETVHSPNQTRQSFRRIVVRWKNEQPDLFEAEDYCYDAVATNRAEAESASEVLGRPNQRGEAENGHKELKLEWGWSRRRAGSRKPTLSFRHRGSRLQSESDPESEVVAVRVPAGERWRRGAGKCIVWRRSWCGRRGCGC